MSGEIFTVTFFANYAATTNRREALTLKELAARIAITSAPSKAALPWLKLATFGDVRSPKGSLRHDANMLAITGVEADYDGEKLTFDDAIEIIEKAGLEALIYTSPSHQRDGHGPRWRIVCPLSREYPPAEREQFLNRLAGLFRDGNLTVLAAESWTASQAYYFGAVAHNPEHRVFLVEGQALDELDELDLIALGKPGKPEGEDKTGPHRPGPPQASIGDIRAALNAIPNDWTGWERWNTLGMAVFAASGGSGRGYGLFSRWSRRNSDAYDKAATKERWRHWQRSSPPSRIGFGTLMHLARQADPAFVLPGAGDDAAKALAAFLARQPPPGPGDIDPEGVRLDDFYAYMEQHNYIYAPTRAPWPGGSVNARLPLVPLFNPDGTPVLDKKGNQVKALPTAWLDKHRPVEQITWAPGRPMIIRDRLISEGGWITRRNVGVFNLYRPPLLAHGDPDKAGRWIAHVDKVYPEDAEHIRHWFAHRVQHPEDKINHALVLAGSQGIGKDSLIEPVKRAIGPWNVAEASPTQLTGPFNGFVKSVILRISEAHDLGEIDRYQFYEHLKVYTAAPPDVLRVNEKNLREYNSLNCCGVIITTNHKTDGIYLPADDRHHYVAWSYLMKEDFTQDYWNDLWGFYDTGGDHHVAAYLAQLDLSGFNPKAPPPKTAAFWDIVNASRVPEDAEMADALDHLKNPDAVTLISVINAAASIRNHDFADWLRDRKNRRIIPHRLEACGYVPVRNPYRDNGLWVIDGRRQVVYAKAKHALGDQIKAAEELRK